MLAPKAMGTLVHTREGTKMEKRPKTAAPQSRSRVTPAALQGLLEYHSRLSDQPTTLQNTDAGTELEIKIPDPPLNYFAALGKLLNFTEPPFLTV